MSHAANRSPSFPSRRDVLRLSAGATAALISPLSLFCQEKKDAGGPTLGFSTYGMKGLPTERSLRTLAEIGYDAVELAVRSGWDADSAQLKPARRRTLRALLKDLPIKLSALMEHVQPVDNKQQAEALHRLKLAAELAHDLAPSAPPLIQTVLGGGRFGDVKKPLRDRLAEWMKLADASDVVFAIKPHRGGAVSQPAEAVWLFEQLGKPNRLRMVYDYSHYAFRDLPLEQTIQTALPYTAHIAVKDAVQEGNKILFKLPGEAGTVDYPKIIRQFAEAGYRGDFNCEVSGMVSSRPGYDPIEAAKTCYANLSAAFEKAGINRSKPA